MSQSWRSWRRKLGLASALTIGGALALGRGLFPITSFGGCTFAQIILNATLGSESSVVTAQEVPLPPPPPEAPPLEPLPPETVPMKDPTLPGLPPAETVEKPVPPMKEPVPPVKSPLRSD